MAFRDYITNWLCERAAAPDEDLAAANDELGLVHFSIRFARKVDVVPGSVKTPRISSPLSTTTMAKFTCRAFGPVTFTCAVPVPSSATSKVPVNSSASTVPLKLTVCFPSFTSPSLSSRKDPTARTGPTPARSPSTSKPQRPASFLDLSFCGIFPSPLEVQPPPLRYFSCSPRSHLTRNRFAPRRVLRFSPAPQHHGAISSLIVVSTSTPGKKPSSSASISFVTSK